MVNGHNPLIPRMLRFLQYLQGFLRPFALVSRSRGPLVVLKRVA